MHLSVWKTNGLLVCMLRNRNCMLMVAPLSARNLFKFVDKDLDLCNLYKGRYKAEAD